MAEGDPSPKSETEQKEAYEQLKKRRSDASEVQKMFQLSGVGFEFIIAVGGFAALGWWLDKKFAASPIWTIVGVSVGFAVGLYRLVLFAKRTMK